MAEHPAGYASIYRKYLGVTPPVPFDACREGEWIPADQIDRKSSLHAVLERGRLRIGHGENPPQQVAGFTLAENDVMTS